MLFLGYWALWFLLGFFLIWFGKLKIADGNLFTLAIFALILALPSWFIHLAFIE